MFFKYGNSYSDPHRSADSYASDSVIFHGPQIFRYLESAAIFEQGWGPEQEFKFEFQPRLYCVDVQRNKRPFYTLIV